MESKESINNGFKDNHWDSMEDWSKRHPFDPTLYANESEWRTANHIDDTREKILLEATGALSNFEMIDKASNFASKEDVNFYEALLKVDNEGDTVDKYVELKVIDAIEKEHDWNMGCSKGMIEFVKLQRKAVDFAQKKESRFSESLRFNAGAMDYLENEINDYMFNVAGKNDAVTLPQFLNKRLELIKQKSELLEKQGKTLSEGDAMDAKGISAGLAFLSLLMDGYQEKKNVLNNAIGSY